MTRGLGLAVIALALSGCGGPRDSVPNDAMEADSAAANTADNVEEAVDNLTMDIDTNASDTSNPEDPPGDSPEDPPGEQ